MAALGLHESHRTFTETVIEEAAHERYSRQELFNMKVTDVETSLPNESAWHEHVRVLKQTEFVIMEGTVVSNIV